MMLLPLPELETPPPMTVVDYAPLLDRLAGSAFRRRKRLLGSELDQLRARGLEEVVRHAERFVTERLAPALPANDGRQTPYRGHPAFIAQHATATCCRGCLEIWHSVPKGRPLTDGEVAWVVGLIASWLGRETGIDVSDLLTRPDAASATRVRRAPRRRSSTLRLVVAEDDAADGPLVLEERLDDGSVVRRWLQMELFGGRE